MDSVGRIRAGTVQPAAPEAAGIAKPGSSVLFQVDATEAATSTSATGPLAALRAGTVDRQGYVDAHIAQATAHLSMLPADKQQMVRELLRAHCESDSVLTDLITRATGQG